MTVDVNQYDPAPDDLAKYERAISRRNMTWGHFQAAEQLLRHAETKYAGAELAPFIRNYNEAQHDYEWAERDLVKARVFWRASAKGQVVLERPT